MTDLHQIVEELSQLTVMEAAELSRMLEERWGVSAAQPVQTVIADVAPVVAAEPDEFSIILAGIVADKKINVIKEIRSITGLGLKEAKDFTEKASPTQVVKDSLQKAEAESLKARLEEAGAVVTMQ